MFSFTSIQSDRPAVVLINGHIAHLEALLNLHESSEKQEAHRLREKFHAFFSKTENVKDRLCNLGYAALGREAKKLNKENISSGITRLTTIAEQITLFRHVLALTCSQLAEAAQHARELRLSITTLLHNSEENQLQEKEIADLNKNLEVLNSLEREVMEAMKAYLLLCRQDATEASDGLLFHFLGRMEQVINQFRPRYQQNAITSSGEIEKLFLEGRLDPGKMPRDTHAPGTNHAAAVRRHYDYFSHYIYLYGEDKDREFLEENGIQAPSYLQELKALSNQGVALLKSLWHLPAAMREHYDARKRAKSLKEKPYDRLQQAAYNRLAVYDLEHPRDRYRIDDLVTEIPEDLLPAAEIKNPDHDITAGKTAALPEKPYSQFGDFYREIKDFSVIHSHLHRDVLLEENLDILKAVCRRLDDADTGYFYTADELEKIQDAARLLKDNSDQDINKLNRIKEGMRAKIRHEKYRTAAAEFDAEREKNIFTALMTLPANENRRDEIALIQEEWQRQRPFYYLSSPSLIELTERLRQMENYIGMMKQNFFLGQDPGLYLSYMTGISKDHQTAIQTLIIKAETLIAQERGRLINAMLARLSLAASQKPSGNSPLCDDVVYATMSSLTSFGLSPQYVKQFGLQSPPHQTLTRELITAFNDFILQYGDEAQKEKLEKIQPGMRLNIEPQPNELKQDDNVILIPSSIAGHYHLRIKADDKASDDMDTSLIYLAPESDTGTGVMPDHSSMKIDESGMGISFFDCATGERVYMPSDSRLVEVDLDDDIKKEFGSFYELVQEHTPETVADPDEFVYVLNASQLEFIQQQAETYFTKKLYQHMFVESARHSIESARKCDENINIHHACKAAYSDVAQYGIDHEADSLFDGLNLPDVENEYREVAAKLANQLHQSRDPVGGFEKNVIDKAYDIVFSIRRRMHDMKLEIRQSGVSESGVNMLTEYYLMHAYDYLHKAIDNGQTINLKEVIAEAELDTLIYSHEGPIHQGYRTEFRNHIKNCVMKQVNWTENTTMWDEKIRQARKYIDLKSRFAMFLDQEKTRVDTNRTLTLKKKTQEKLNQITSCQTSLNTASDTKDVINLVRGLESNTKFTQKRGLFRFFSFFGSTSKKHLHQFVETAGIPRMNA